MKNLKLPCSTLHGRADRSHRRRSYEIHTRGVDRYLLAKEGAEHLKRIFDSVIDPAEAVGNQSRVAGLTGRASAKAKRKALETAVETGNPQTKTRRRSTA